MARTQVLRAPSRMVHAVCAYWPMSREGFSAKAHGQASNAASIAATAGAAAGLNTLAAGTGTTAAVAGTLVASKVMLPLAVGVATVAGVGYARAFVAKGPIVYLGGYGGREQEVNDRDAQWGSNLYGVRVGAEQSIGEKYSWSMMMGVII